MSKRIVDNCVQCGQSLLPIRSTRRGRDVTRWCSNACWRAYQFTVEYRFWEKVDKNGPVPVHRPELGQCWVWTGSLNDSGYGMMTALDGHGQRRRNYRAHRGSWELHIGTIPPDRIILHKCDNPPCVNPQHLMLGTHKDNVDDMDAKGRRRVGTSPGERNYLAKLTDDDILNIRQAYVNGFSQVELATIFECTQTNISSIVNGKAWKHVGGQITIGKTPYRASFAGSNNGRSKLNDDTVRYIRSAHAAGVQQRELAKELGLGQATVSRVVRREGWRHVT